MKGNNKKQKIFLICVLLILLIPEGQIGNMPVPAVVATDSSIVDFKPDAPVLDTVAEIEIADIDTVATDVYEDIPIKVARLIGDQLILSTEGIPLDADEIHKQIEKEAERRADTNCIKTYCTESMAFFNIVDDWAQIITFKRKDDSYLVFLIQYYDWREGYGIIKTHYYNLTGDCLVPTVNPFKNFDYWTNNEDSLKVRFDFRTIKSQYDPTRLKLNTAIQYNVPESGVDVVNAELLWTGRDFIELASDHSMPNKDDVLRIWTNAMPSGAELPSQYARTDIDSDGSDEYIFRVDDGTMNRFAIFSYLDGNLKLIAGNYDNFKRDVSIFLGGYVVLKDEAQSRYIKILGSEIWSIHIQKDDKYYVSIDRTSALEEITKEEFTKSIRRMRKQINYNTLDWRYWSAMVAK